MLADVDTSLLGSTDRVLIRLTRAGAPWEAEVAVRLCGSMESIETMEGALERTGEIILSLLPQETMWVAIRRDNETAAAACFP